MRQQLNKNTEDKSTNVASDRAREECEKQNDKDLCKFIANRKNNVTYRRVSISPEGSVTYETNDDRSHMVMNGAVAYEAIYVANTSYIKAGNIWYKQTVKELVPANATGKIPGTTPVYEEGATYSEDKADYKKLGKEPCGDLSCFKYEIINSENTGVKETIWFDDKDYRIRKNVSQSAGGTTETTYVYDSINIPIPSPVKELAPDQYIIPGQTEPQILSRPAS